MRRTHSSESHSEMAAKILVVLIGVSICAVSGKALTAVENDRFQLPTIRHSTKQILKLEDQLKQQAGEDERYYPEDNAHRIPQIDGLETPDLLGPSDDISLNGKSKEDVLQASDEMTASSDDVPIGLEDSLQHFAAHKPDEDDNESMQGDVTDTSPETNSDASGDVDSPREDELQTDESKSDNSAQRDNGSSHFSDSLDGKAKFGEEMAHEIARELSGGSVLRYRQILARLHLLHEDVADDSDISA